MLIRRLKRLFKRKQIKSEIIKEGFTIEEYVKSKGYLFEKHLIETEDGYLIEIFRIPGYVEEPPQKASNPKQPILIQHGLLDSAEGFIMNKEERCIPFILAYSGFDVWLANARGNKYGLAHKKYNVESQEFWQFSFHEQGIYDIPAMIEYIKTKNTCKEKIIFMGHSQGTTAFFIGVSEKTEYYQNNVKLFVGFGPIARLTSINSTIFKLVEKANAFGALKKLGIYDIFPANGSRKEKFTRKVAAKFPGLCKLGIELLCDENSKEYNDPEQFILYSKHYPSGTSLKVFLHFLQIYRAKKFIRYDYGKEANFAFYHSPEPTEYDISKFGDIKVILLRGENDRLATEEDINWIYEQIKDNVICMKKIPNFGHCSFVFAKSIDWFEETYDIICDKFNIYSPENTEKKDEDND